MVAASTNMPKPDDVERALSALQILHDIQDTDRILQGQREALEALARPKKKRKHKPIITITIKFQEDDDDAFTRDF